MSAPVTEPAEVVEAAAPAPPDWLRRLGGWSALGWATFGVPPQVRAAPSPAGEVLELTLAESGGEWLAEVGYVPLPEGMPFTGGWPLRLESATADRVAWRVVDPRLCCGRLRAEEARGACYATPPTDAPPIEILRGEGAQHVRVCGADPTLSFGPSVAAVWARSKGEQATARLEASAAQVGGLRRDAAAWSLDGRPLERCTMVALQCDVQRVRTVCRFAGGLDLLLEDPPRRVTVHEVQDCDGPYDGVHLAGG